MYDDREVLREFLRGKRRRANLTQEAVAELSSVSLNWYELFESGRGSRRVSFGFLKRVASALRLSESERDELFRLAKIHDDASALLTRGVEEGAGDASKRLASICARISSAKDFQEIAVAAAEGLQDWLRPDSSTIVTLRDGPTLFGFGVGPYGKYVNGSTAMLHWNTLRSLPVGKVGVIRGGPSVEELAQRAARLDVIAHGEGNERLDDLSLTPEIYHDALYRARIASSIDIALIVEGRLQGLIGICWQQSRDFSALEIESARVVSCLVRLATDSRLRQ